MYIVYFICLYNFYPSHSFTTTNKLLRSTVFFSSTSRSDNDNKRNNNNNNKNRKIKWITPTIEKQKVIKHNTILKKSDHKAITSDHKAIHNKINVTTIGIVSTMESPKNIKTWLHIHKQFGIRHFYIRLENTPELFDYLDNRSDVTVKRGKDHMGIDEYFDLQRRQREWVEEALFMAKNDCHGVKWLIHMDSDELLDGTLQAIEKLEPHIRTFWMENYEAKYKKVKGRDDPCFTASKFVRCQHPGKGESCVSYGNGKGGGRVAEDIHPWGPHRFTTWDKKYKAANNFEAKVIDLRIHHFESCDFEMFKEKFKRLATEKNEKKIPFPYYKDSIEAAKKGDFKGLYDIYKKYKVDHLLVKTDDDNMKIKEGKKKEKTNIRSSPSIINNTYQSGDVKSELIMINGKQFKVIDIGKL